MTPTKHQSGTYYYYLAPAGDRQDAWSAGYADNCFATREEAEKAIPHLRACGEDFAAVEWVVVEASS